tara:strand:+ start:186 stop:569 length:384 start_codon:yes stop_codon:yes gene_type:complete
MAIEYVRRTSGTNQEYFNKQVQQAINDLVNRANINYRKITSVTATLLVDDLFIDVNVSNAVTLTLPPSPPIGTNYIIKDSSGSAGTNNITVSANTGNTVQGSASTSITTDFGSVQIIYDGTNKWLII